MIRLNKITAKNFKVFGEEPFHISIEEHKLILLDGPNGYGKTSIFDAIELGLTGNIDRLISLENRQSPNDVVVAHRNNNDSVEITLEFLDKDQNARIFKRKLKPGISNAYKKISKFSEIWDLYEVKDEIETPINQTFLDQFFDSTNFSRDFLLFHYIQQEETAHFLKSNSETQRAEKLAKLFGNTVEADSKLEHLKSVSKKIKSSHRAIVSKIDAIQKKYNFDDVSLIELNAGITYSCTFPWLVDLQKSPIWDTATIQDFTQERLNYSLDDIEKVKSFLHFKEFHIRNRTFTIASKQNEVIEAYIVSYRYIDKIDSLLDNNRKHKVIESILPVLKTHDLSRIKSLNDLGITFDILGMTGFTEFVTALSLIIDFVSNTNGVSSIISEFLNLQNSYLDKIYTATAEKNCPLCGTNYDSHDDLINVIIDHENDLRSKLSSQEMLSVEKRKEFITNNLLPLIDKCTEYLNANKPISEPAVSILEKAKFTKDRLEKFNNWLNSEGIICSDIFTNDLLYNYSLDKLSQISSELQTRIILGIGIPPNGYQETNIDGDFDRIYRDYFLHKQEHIDLFNLEKLDEKQKYLKNLHISSLSEISNELQTLNEKSLFLKKAANDIDSIIDELDTKIKIYKKKLITDIEIPFYIYSGKILQTHQVGIGNGIFIKDPTGDDELKNVRLVSNFDSDHDILNTMSSGQISAIVLALSLALNKVYSKNLSCIFIDDPLQTMDDINVSSFIELLRNDFCDSQIIISTHEEKASRYFTYKYLKHGKSVKIYNLMKRQNYTPINKYQYTKSVKQ